MMPLIRGRPPCLPRFPLPRSASNWISPPLGWQRRRPGLGGKPSLSLGNIIPDATFEAVARAEARKLSLGVCD
jgi:hypothetical protein